jgi:hypothetical protein
MQHNFYMYSLDPDQIFNSAELRDFGAILDWL